MEHVTAAPPEPHRRTAYRRVTALDVLLVAALVLVSWLATRRLDTPSLTGLGLAAVAMVLASNVAVRVSPQRDQHSTTGEELGIIALVIIEPALLPWAALPAAALTPLMSRVMGPLGAARGDAPVKVVFNAATQGLTAIAAYAAFTVTRSEGGSLTLAVLAASLALQVVSATLVVGVVSLTSGAEGARSATSASLDAVAPSLVLALVGALIGVGVGLTPAPLVALAVVLLAAQLATRRRLDRVQRRMASAGASATVAELSFTDELEAELLAATRRTLGASRVEIRSAAPGDGEVGRLIDPEQATWLVAGDPLRVSGRFDDLDELRLDELVSAVSPVLRKVSVVLSYDRDWSSSDRGTEEEGEGHTERLAMLERHALLIERLGSVTGPTASGRADLAVVMEAIERRGLTRASVAPGPSVIVELHPDLLEPIILTAVEDVVGATVAEPVVWWRLEGRVVVLCIEDPDRPGSDDVAREDAETPFPARLVERVLTASGGRIELVHQDGTVAAYLHLPTDDTDGG